MIKIAFEQHLNSINKAYASFFKNKSNVDFKIIYKPNNSSKKIFIIRYFLFYIRCFFNFIFKYDLVHINGTKLGFVAYIASFFGCRYIYTIHGFVINKSYYRNGVIEKLDILFMKLCCTRAKSVNTISFFSKKKLKEIYGVDANVIYNGFDCQIFKEISESVKIEIKKKYNIPLDSIVYVSVGRINKAKNPFLVVDKFIQISKNFDNAFLIIVGDGVLYQDVHNYLDYKELSERSLLIRSIPFENISELYGISTFFISGCREEKFGLVALEALACGCRPLLPRSGAFPELYSSPEFFFEPDVISWEDDSSFQKKRIEILSSLEWEKSISKYENIYYKISRG